MTLREGSHVHLIGICGTAMAGLAALLQARGFRVTGSDESVYPPMSGYLEQLGIRADSGFHERHLDPAPDLVVIGNAVRRGNPEAELVLDRRMPFTSLPALMREVFLTGCRVAVVAGTHGKTTTGSMLAHILTAAGGDPSFLIGGIPIGPAAPARLGSDGIFVLEGDEYDTAFFDKGPKLMHYLPDVAILNAVEMDHADIYRDLETVKLQFRRWINIIPRRSLLLVHGDDANAVEAASAAHCRVATFGLGSGHGWAIENLRESPEGTVLSLSVAERAAARGGGPGQAGGAAGEGAIAREPGPVGGGRVEERARIEVALPTVGAFNARNAVAAIAAAVELGLPADRAARAMATFRGVRRRLEVKGEVKGIVVVDDFAHHPTAIRETIRAARARWPGRRLIGILEPRSWSLRRSVFQDLLPDALGGADRVALSAVYHGEMLADSERLNVPLLAQVLSGRGVAASHHAGAGEIVEALLPELRPGDVLLVMSNGGFDGIHERFLAALEARGLGVEPPSL